MPLNLQIGRLCDPPGTTIGGTTINDIAQFADSLHATTPVDDAAHPTIDGTRLRHITRTSYRRNRPGTSADVGPIG